MWNHRNYKFVELEQVFCRWYWIVQNDEHVYLKVQKFEAKANKKSKDVLNERLLKLANSFKHLLLVIFWQQYFDLDHNHIYMCITTTRMISKILQQHKEFALTCEEGIFLPQA